MDIYKIQTKCDVCGNGITVDNYGNGSECPVCGWRQSEESFNHPDVAGIRNIPTLNNAKRQFREGKSVTLANFEDFISAFDNYGELEFTYDCLRFGVLFDDESCRVVLMNLENNQKQYFLDVDSFARTSKINGVLLKDLWNNVTNTDFLQET